jgi:hypothetical protein
MISPEQQEIVIKAVIVGVALICIGIWQWRKKVISNQEEPVDISSVIVQNESQKFNELLQTFVEKTNQESNIIVSEPEPEPEPVPEPVPEPLILNPTITEQDKQLPKIIRNFDNSEDLPAIKIIELLNAGMSNNDIARLFKISTTEVEMMVELLKRDK